MQPGLYSTHINRRILIGLRAEPMLEAGMRLTPGERQSGDGTSLPETPNNLTNVRNTAPFSPGQKRSVSLLDSRSSLQQEVSL